MNWAHGLARIYVPSQTQANLYGVVLYTDSHPHVKKMLRDEDYWRALHEQSGPRWVIFAVRAQQGSLTMPKVGPNQLGMLVPVWREPKENKPLLEAFQLKSTEKLPALVVFVENEEGNLLRRVLKFDGSSERKAYESLRKAVVLVADALDEVSNEYLREGTMAFWAVSYKVKAFKEWNAIRDSFGIIKKFRSLIADFSSL